MGKYKMKQINWNKQFKVSIRESKKEQAKHLIVKTLISFIIKLKYKKSLRFQRVYTEFPIEEGKICDVYHENFKTKEAYYYEIQKRITNDWLEKTKKTYKDREIWGMKKIDWILVDLSKVGEDIDEIVDYLWEIVV